MIRLVSPAVWMTMALVSVLIVAPARAQETPAPAEAATPAAKSEEERAIEAEAAAFSQSMVEMQEQLVTISRPEEADAIVARYKPAADSLADKIDAFLTANANLPENAARREELLSQAAIGVERVRMMPDFIRNAVDDAIARGNATAEDGQAAAPPAPASDPSSGGQP